MDETSALLADGKAQEALQKADAALTAARTPRDLVGEAEAQRARAKALEQLDRRDEAFAAWREAESAWERAGDGPGRIEALCGAAALLVSARKFDESGPLLEQAVTLARAEKHRPIAAASAMQEGASRVYNHGGLLQSKDLYVAAVELREALVPGSLDLAASLHSLGQTWVVLREARRAEEPLMRSVEIQRKLAPDSHNLARTLYHAGIAAIVGENYSAARDRLEESLAIRDRLNEDPTANLDALGTLAAMQEDYDAAERYYTRCMELDETKAPESRDAGITLVNIGNAKMFKDEFYDARTYFERALRILEKAAPDSLDVALALRGLATLSLILEDLGPAEHYYRRAIEIDKARTPGTSLLVSDSLELAQALSLRDRLQEARELLEELLPITEELSAEDQKCTVLWSLGEIAIKQNDLEAAQAYFEHALPIAESVTSNTRCLAEVLGRRSELSLLRGDVAAARQDITRSLALAEARCGVGGPCTVDALEGAARVEALSGNAARALEQIARAEHIRRDRAVLAIDSLSEREALLYTGQSHTKLDLLVTLAAGPFSGDPSARKAAWDAVVRSRALVLDEMADRNRHTWETEDPETARRGQEVAAARERLARMVLWAGRKRDSMVRPEEFYKARDARDRAERELADRSRLFRQRHAESQAGAAEVAAALPGDAAVVSYVRYERQKLRPEVDSSTPSYAAFVYRSGAAAPEVVQLGGAADVDGLISRVRAEIAQEASAPGRAPKLREAAFREAGAALRVRIWDPLVPHLGKTARVFAVPDGELNLVNFAALPTGRSKYLLEAGPLVHMLAAERDLVRPRADSTGRGLLIVGAPTFDETALFAALSPEPAPAPAAREELLIAEARTAAIFRGSRSVCEDFRSVRFGPLPGSSEEAGCVAALWREVSGGAEAPDGTLVLGGKSANETVLKQSAAGKRVLHLATHAFFAPRRCIAATDASTAPRKDDAAVAVDWESPLVLSGLALAGANNRDAAGPQEDDGVLTAEEIATLDLGATEWAVLSGCDTGLGEIRAGEGLLGLRRAFQVAGVRTVIASLWPVEDETARLWMTSLYTHRFKDGLATAEAVRAASLDILKDRRKRGLGGHPFHWAAFVAVGDWR